MGSRPLHYKQNTVVYSEGGMTAQTHLEIHGDDAFSSKLLHKLIHLCCRINEDDLTGLSGGWRLLQIRSEER